VPIATAARILLLDAVAPLRRRLPDLLARETNLPRWRELQIGYRRLEDRGEVRGGRFVDGFRRAFALPVAVESLRAQRKLPPHANAERIVIAAADPLNS